MGRLSQQVGNRGEAIMRNRLMAAGFLKVRKNETPKGMYRGKLAFTGTASVDFTCIHPVTGQLVHIEVKSYNGKLPHSAVKNNEAELDRYANDTPALAVLAWLDTATFRSYVMPWPIPGFKKGVALTPEMAEQHAISKARDLK